MECTQRLESTQELYATQSERVCPEQIGFLGICGEKYPIIQGPNKIGRDPESCNIILNRNSISRQHAVINVLSAKKIMLMDLGSANKTRLNNKCLPSYIPAHLSNGDMVQLGELFGVFRLLEDENDLPMTQAIDIPETPLGPRGVSKVNKAVTLVPESPDVSDRDDSFITPTQPKQDHQFKSPSNRVFKPKSLSSHIANSSKKSSSFNLNDSTISLNNSEPSCSKNDSALNSNNIHEMDTQLPCSDIYNAATQLPQEFNHQTSPSIHSMDTQLPYDNPDTREKNDDQQVMEVDLTDSDNSIHNAQTQLPFVKNSENKMFGLDDDENFFEAETQLPTVNKDHSPVKRSPVPITDTRQSKISKDEIDNGNTSEKSKSDSGGSKVLIKSDEIILFDEVDDRSFLEAFDSQPLLPQEDSPEDNAIPLSQSSQEVILKPTSAKRANRIESDSTDCEDLDVVPTKNMLSKGPEDEDLTDCEDDIEIEPNKPKEPVSVCTPLVNSTAVSPRSPVIGFKELTAHVAETIDDSKKTEAKDNQNTDFEDMATQVIPEKRDLNIEDIATQVIPENKDIDFENMATQVIEENPCVSVDKNQYSEEIVKPSSAQAIPGNKHTDIEDIATQVIPENKDIDFEDMATQVIEENPSASVDKNQYSEEIVNPFKVPMCTPLKAKKRDSPKKSDNRFLNRNILVPKSPVKIVDLAGDEQYYGATQDIYNDLCSQKELSEEPLRPSTTKTVDISLMNEKQIEIFKVGSNCEPGSADGQGGKLRNELSPTKKYVVANSLSESSDGDDKINKFVSNLTSKQVNEVIGINVEVANVKRTPSDPSDVEVTPKKVRPLKFFETELPDSQEIKSTVSETHRSYTNEVWTDSEPEQNSEDQHTPILFRQKKRVKDAKADLSKKFEQLTLPTRVLTRVRKPAAKLQDGDEETKKRTKNILKPKYLDEDDVDKEIISENISRLKSKSEKNSGKDVSLDLAQTEKLKKAKKSRENKKDDLKLNSQEKSINKENDRSLTSTAETSKSTRSTRNTRQAKAVNNKSDNVSEKVESQDKELRRSGSPNEKLKRGRVSSRKVGNIKSENEDSKLASQEKESRRSDSPLEETKTSDRVTPRMTRNKKSEKDDEKCQPQEKESGRSDSPMEESNKSGRISRQTRQKSATIEDYFTKDVRKSASPKETRRLKQTDDKNEDKDDSTKETKKKRGRPKKSDVEKIDLTTEIIAETVENNETLDNRRSKRKQTVKTNDTSQNKRPKRCKPSDDQSTVYNISDDSVDSPKPVKRPASGEIPIFPIPRRTRTAVSSNAPAPPASSSSLKRSTPARRIKQHYVLFTAFPSEDVKTKLEQLGAIVVSDVMSCTVVLTLQIKRTFKLLCAVGLGKPIVGPDWVQACHDTKTIVDPWLYLIKDEASEKRFEFNLARTLSGKRNFLKGYHVSATPSVLPGADEMKLIVECSGGTWHAIGTVPSPNTRWACVSCPNDRSLWPALRARGAQVVTAEFILGGVLTQTVNIERNLFK